MSTTLNANFATRREAEMTIERLVQEYGIERTDIFVSAEGDENTAGVEQAGSDIDTSGLASEPRGSAPLEGAITVSVDVEDGGLADRVRAAFTEFAAEEIIER